jgi:hypothetical protein
MGLETDEGVSDVSHTPKLGRRLADCPISQLEKVGQLGLVKLADAFLDVLRKDEI